MTYRRAKRLLDLVFAVVALVGAAMRRDGISGAGEVTTAEFLGGFAGNGAVRPP